MDTVKWIRINLEKYFQEFWINFFSLDGLMTNTLSPTIIPVPPFFHNMTAFVLMPSLNVSFFQIKNTIKIKYSNTILKCEILQNTS